MIAQSAPRSLANAPLLPLSAAALDFCYNVGVGNCTSSELDRNGDGYVYIGAQYAWRGWKASRAALCVEMPKTGEESSFGNFVVFDTELVKEILGNAGVSYK